MAQDIAWLVERPVAHRGLHDAHRPENSIAAARAAITGGYAIECDVLLSSDRVPMIFHDDLLERLTGCPGRLDAHSAAELQGMALLGSAERIPTVADFLHSVEGAVPIVMELKGASPEADSDFMERLRPLLDTYPGELALMSFDAWLVDQALAYGKRAVGLTAEGTEKAVLDAHRAVFDRGCAFVSYNVEHLPNDFVRYVREDRRAPVITWTVRSPDEIAATKAYADQMTFEGFLPQD